MSSSSSSSLPVPADWLLPLMACPLYSDEVVTAVARTGNQAGHRFYKCIRYDARQCCFFEFQRVYCRRMTHEQILAAQHQAGWHPAGHGFAVQHGNGAAQIVPAALQAQAQQHIQPLLQPQIQAPVQPPPPSANHLIADAFRPVVAAAASPGAQGLAAVAVLMAAINIMLTVLVLMVVLAMYFA
ncbi:uncharacterized protein [Triticum aestivum]|uniref:uncharacterized protein n=1 Tax=Triticum aestivum TaxID=4565 RepID=UPI001D02CEA2|nr:uncharacterized protein LOC123039918 [Triticum aestivum]